MIEFKTVEELFSYRSACPFCKEGKFEWYSDEDPSMEIKIPISIAGNKFTFPKILKLNPWSFSCEKRVHKYTLWFSINVNMETGIIESVTPTHESITFTKHVGRRGEDSFIYKQYKVTSDFEDGTSILSKREGIETTLEVTIPVMKDLNPRRVMKKINSLLAMK